MALVLAAMLCGRSAAADRAAADHVAEAALFTARPTAFAPTSGKVVGVYVPNWKPTALLAQLPRGNVTHLLYAFLHICGPGQLDKDAAACAVKTDFELATSAVDGRFNAAFARFKQRAPEVKVLASVGGWGGSDPFFHLANDPARRRTFAASAARFLGSHPAFDGIDIDWEHPGANGSANGVALGSPADGQGYADLMLELRHALDGLSARTGRRYLLTAAINTSESMVAKVNHAQAARAMDLVFMMTYDFAGAWTPLAGHHTPFKSASAESTDSLEGAVRVLTRAGVPARKLVAGVAMYGRGFGGVAGPGANHFNGVPRAEVFPPGAAEGAVAYRELAAAWLGRDGRGAAGWQSVFDDTTQSYGLWHEEAHRYIGYDDPRTVVRKGRYAVEQGLAGVFAWELSQDNGDILNAMNRGVGQKRRGAAAARR
jgi:chitinase